MGVMVDMILAAENSVNTKQHQVFVLQPDNIIDQFYTNSKTTTAKCMNVICS